MATHVSEVIKVCLPFRSCLFKSLVKQTELSCKTTLYDEINVVPVRSMNRWRLSHPTVVPSFAVPRTNYERQLGTAVRYNHKHSCKHDGNGDDCCCSKSNRYVL